MVEWMLQMIGDVGNYVTHILPTSPFADFINSFQPPEYLGWLSWIFPVHDIIVILISWLGAITFFYGFSVILRWVKLIGD